MVPAEIMAKEIVKIMLRTVNKMIDFVRKYMYFTNMMEQQWQKMFEQGRNLLIHKNIKSALHLFSRALKSCPCSEPKALEKIIFYTGITLQKMGMSSCALKTWKSALSFGKNGLSAKMFRRYSNQYGMPKQESPAEDDRQAFLAVQRRKYLSGKKSGKFCTEAEEDMVNELIAEKWQTLYLNDVFSGMNAEHKLQFFYSVTIYFPFVQVPEHLFEAGISQNQA
jgi:hypothetical protein